MFTSIATGAIGMVLLALCWLAVQQAWSRVFPEACADPDPLAERIRCSECETELKCGKRFTQRKATTRKEIP